MNSNTNISYYMDHSINWEDEINSIVPDPIPPNPFWWKQYLNNRTNKKNNIRNKKSKKS